MAEPLLTTRQHIMKAGKTINKPGVPLKGGKADFITIHETDNTAVGANAEMHRRFVHNGGGPNTVSFHAAVDSRESVQILSWYEAAYHAADGGGPGNYDSLGIETCVNRDGDWEATKRNLIVLVKNLMREFSLPITRVRQHNGWSGKNCPQKLRANGGKEWAEIMKVLGATSTVANFFDPVTGFFISGGFLVEYRRLEKLGVALQLVGRPISPEYTRTIGSWTGTVQEFERARIEWHTESGSGQVLYGLINVERLDAERDLLECQAA